MEIEVRDAGMLVGCVSIVNTASLYYEQGIKKAELARRLGWHTPQVDRLFDLRLASRLDQIEAAAAVLGRHLEVRVT